MPEDRLEKYRSIIGTAALDEIRRLGACLSGRKILNVNATALGGGVAEILRSMVPLMNELGVPTYWQVINGSERFYTATKKIHNALHGAEIVLSADDREILEQTFEQNRKSLTLDHDIFLIHDPQPIGLVTLKQSLGRKWIWRCHVDVSNPHPDSWALLKPYIEQYDAAVFSSIRYQQKLSIPQEVVAPSIDPLSEKNQPMSDEQARSIAERLQVPLDKPLVTQVSRFDRLKDPVGVIQAFRKVQKDVDARLLLVGGAADDDPEGQEVLAEVQEAAGKDEAILIRSLPPISHLEINALQRLSTIIVQKSLKEGFGLTITEALWKGKPVIASAVGGIPLQIEHEKTGILVHSIEETASWMRRLLRAPEWAARLGERGREHVRGHFLITRHIGDYLRIFLSR